MNNLSLLKKRNKKMQNILKIEGYKLLNQEVYRLLKKSITKEFLEPGY